MMSISKWLAESSFYFLLAIIFIYLASKYAKTSNKRAKKPPEPSGSWPIIGHLLLLGGSNQLLHRTLGAMADKLGPVFCIQIGIQKALVVSNWEAVKECFTTNDKVFPERPKYLAVKIMGYNYIMIGFAPYSQYWRDMRKLATVELLSNRRLELLKHIRDTEVDCLMKELYLEAVNSGGEVKVEMKGKFGDLAMNIIVRMMAGKRFYGSNNNMNRVDESRRFQKALGNFLYLIGLILASDTVPILGWLDWVKGYVGEMKRTARELDGVFGSWVKEHREKGAKMVNHIEEDHDFIDVMLSVLEDGGVPSDEVDTIIKGNCLSLILGGNDTTVITLTWALSLLLNNPSALRKAREELDIQVGNRKLQESDIKNLVYLQAIVKETLRLYPALPLSAARIALEDCTVSGFRIPAGTHLLVNMWKLHRDPNIWSDPLEFQPERFLQKHADMDVRGRDFEYIPFGSGRRMCPGVTLGLQVVQLTLARLLHGFEIATVLNGAVDMSEGPGLTMPKATPLEAVLRPRLLSTFYNAKPI